MTPFAIILIIVIYFGILLVISHIMSKNNSGNDAFFNANKNSKWYLVAFGMIGTAISGITFISVPGEVGNPDIQFKYFQFVLGCAVGFLVVLQNEFNVYLQLYRATFGYCELQNGGNHFLDWSHDWFSI
jgi:Na+/proline symporter